MDETLVFGLFLILPIVFGWLLVLFIRQRRKQKTKASWPQLIAGNALVLFLLLSLLLLGGESYFRFIYDATDSMDYTKVNLRWLQRYWQLNSSQVRDNINYHFPRHGNARRVTFVGDSFTTGHGVKNVDDRFVNLIRRAHPEWEVHMLAMNGNDTGDEIKMLLEGLAQNYQLDQVVLVYCLNDISDLLPERFQAIERIRADLAHCGWLRNGSYLINIIYHRYAVRHDPFMKDYFGLVLDAYRGPVWEQQKQRLTEFRDLVQSRGGHLSVVTFPFLHALGPDYKYKFVHDELNQFWREAKVPHLDLLPIYANLPPKQITVNRFDVHPNEYAHSLAADAIDKFLKEQMATTP